MYRSRAVHVLLLSHLTVFFLTAAVLLPGGVGYADTTEISTGFGEADSFDSASFSTVGFVSAVGIDGHLALAQPFTVPPGEEPDADVHLHSIEIPVTALTGSRDLEVRVLGDNVAAGPGGAPNEDLVLEQFHVTPAQSEQLPGPPGPQAILLLQSTKGPLLRAGSRYWLALSVKEPDQDTSIQWWGTAPMLRPGPTTIARRVNQGPWVPVQVSGLGQAFRIKASPVPDPDRSIYTFTRITDTSGPVRRFDTKGSVSVDPSGTVVFWAALDNGRQGIFKGTGNGGPITGLADSKGEFAEITRVGASPYISPGGTVALVGTLKTGTDTMFLSTGVGSLEAILDETGPFDRLGQPTINSSGTVAFLAGLDTQGGGIFTVRSQNVTTIAHTSGRFHGFYDRLSINEKGTIAFAGQLDSGPHGVFTSRDGTLTRIADTSDAFTALGAPVLNDRGTVAFWGCLDASGPTCREDPASLQGLFTGNGGPVTTVADSRGPYRSFGSPALNNHGVVAFVAVLDSEGVGLFTGPDPASDKVIAVGDRLSESYVADLGFFHGLGLNDAGQVAFYAQLMDGRQGIYLASPNVVQ
jgi:hypothetical protein